MSEQRKPDIEFTRKIARENGKFLHENCIATKIELFGAYQFKRKFKTQGRHFVPKLPKRLDDRRSYSLQLYRIRINGEWYKPGYEDYVFLDMDEVLEVLRTEPNTGEFIL